MHSEDTNHVADTTAMDIDPVKSKFASTYKNPLDPQMDNAISFLIKIGKT